jgi:hypothetical protein
MNVKTPSVLPSYTITSAYTIKNAIDDIETKMLEENVNRVILRLMIAIFLIRQELTSGKAYRNNNI